MEIGDLTDEERRAIEAQVAPPARQIARGAC